MIRLCMFAELAVTTMKMLLEKLKRQLAQTAILNILFNVCTSFHLFFRLFCIYSVEGCTTYKKTLSEKDKNQLTPVKARKKLRSLKQRVTLLKRISYIQIYANQVFFYVDRHMKEEDE